MRTYATVRSLVKPDRLTASQEESMVRMVRWVLMVAAVLAMPVLAIAQEATITGTVSDSTGAVLPSVTVTAVNDATGNTFEGVTDERGIYRISARVGTYTVRASLQ